jgi:hypothetical protein
MIMPARSASEYGSVASTCFIVNTTVEGSGASTLPTFRTPPNTGAVGMPRRRSMFALTTLASSIDPSWNSTPSRICIVNVVPSSDHSQDSARPGSSSPSGVR